MKLFNYNYDKRVSRCIPIKAKRIPHREIDNHVNKGYCVGVHEGKLMAYHPDDQPRMKPIPPLLGKKKREQFKRIPDCVKVLCDWTRHGQE